MSMRDERLQQAFDEKKRAQERVKKREKRLADAQERVDAARQLQAAAPVQLKNAQARYRVLESQAAAPADPNCRPEVAASLNREKELIEGLRKLVGDQVAAIQESKTKLQQASASVQAPLDDMPGVLDEVRKSVGKLGRSPARPGGTASTSAATRRNGLQELSDEREKLMGQHSRCGQALQELNTVIDAVTAVGLSEDQEQALDARMTEIDEQLTKLAAAPAPKPCSVDPSDLAKAKEDLDDAECAAEEAPRAVRHAQTDLEDAQEALTEAQACQQAAQAQLDKIEAEFITGIDLSCPDAAGQMTAAVEGDVPAGYTVHWRAGSATVKPATGQKVSIDTGQLPVGDTPIEAWLEPTAP